MSLKDCIDTLKNLQKPSKVVPKELHRRIEHLRVYIKNLPIVYDSDTVYKDLKNILLRGGWVN